MVAVSREDKVVWSRFLLTLGVILTLQIGQELMVYFYYNSREANWLPPFDSIYLRFLIRELTVYTNVWMGFVQLKRMGVSCQIAPLFLACSIALDGLFIISGVLRFFLPENQFLMSKYLESFTYMNSGMLFVFCFGLHFVFELTKSDLKKS